MEKLTVGNGVEIDRNKKKFWLKSKLTQVRDKKYTAYVRN